MSCVERASGGGRVSLAARRRRVTLVLSLPSWSASCHAALLVSNGVGSDHSHHHRIVTPYTLPDSKQSSLYALLATGELPPL